MGNKEEISAQFNLLYESNDWRERRKAYEILGKLVDNSSDYGRILGYWTLESDKKCLKNTVDNTFKEIEKRIGYRDHDWKKLGFVDYRHYQEAIRFDAQNPYELTKIKTGYFQNRSEWVKLKEMGFDDKFTWNKAKKLKANNFKEFLEIKKGNFIHRDEWILASEFGVSTAEEWKKVKELGAKNLKEYKKIKIGNFPNREEWSSANKGGFDDAVNWNNAKRLGTQDLQEYLEIKRGNFSNRNEWSSANKGGFDDVVSWNNAKKIGAKNLQEYNGILNGKFTNRNEWFKAKIFGITTAEEWYDVQKIGAKNLTEYSDIKAGQFPNRKNWLNAIEVGFLNFNQWNRSKIVNADNYKELQEIENGLFSNKQEWLEARELGFENKKRYSLYLENCIIIKIIAKFHFNIQIQLKRIIELSEIPQKRVEVYLSQLCNHTGVGKYLHMEQVFLRSEKIYEKIIKEFNQNKEHLVNEIENNFPSEISSIILDEERICIICRTEIQHSEKYVSCPYCNRIGHQTHFEEWLKQKGICPTCRQNLKRTELLYNN